MGHASRCASPSAPLTLLLSSLLCPFSQDCTAPGGTCADPEVSGLAHASLYPPHASDEDLSTWFPHDKANRVCRLLRGALIERLGVAASLQPVLTTYARQSPPDFESALSLIATQCREVWRERLSGEKAQRHLKYLAFFADMNLLYDEALGLYDLDLVRAVARQSQKDPREYGAFLDALQEQEEWKARVQIDVHLKRPGLFIDYIILYHISYI